MTPAEHLRRMAPAQSHEGRRAFLAAADKLDEADLAGPAQGMISVIEMRLEALRESMRKGENQAAVAWEFSRLKSAWEKYLAHGAPRDPRTGER